LTTLRDVHVHFSKWVCRMPSLHRSKADRPGAIEVEVKKRLIHDRLTRRSDNIEGSKAVISSWDTHKYHIHPTLSGDTDKGNLRGSEEYSEFTTGKKTACRRKP